MAIFDIDDDIDYTPTEDDYSYIPKELERFDRSAGLTAYCCYCYRPIKFDAFVCSQPCDPKPSDKTDGFVCGGWQKKCPHCGKTIVLTISKHYKDA